jgi:2,3-bisphosphoglycerate-independent phosphoglycerate mutase
LAIIFVFLDGMGLGPADERNPLWAYPAPFTRQLLGGPLVAGTSVQRPGLLLKGIDAGLGVPGAPQSATGQTALFTGVNAPALIGEHLSAYPNALLRQTLFEHSVLRRAAERGYRPVFANAFMLTYWQLISQRRLRLSASTLATLAAGIPFRTAEDLNAGQAVYWDITHSTLRQRVGRHIPYRSPAQAGRSLAGLAAAGYDLVLFESFLPDMVGHRRMPHSARWLVRTLDLFLEGALEGLRQADSLVMSSDHGNFEYASSRVHTENPVPLLVAGPAATSFAGVTDISQVAAAILDNLGSPERAGSHGSGPASQPARPGEVTVGETGDT